MFQRRFGTGWIAPITPSSAPTNAPGASRAPIRRCRMPKRKRCTWSSQQPATLIEIVDLPVSTGNRIYWSPDGNKLAYFLEPILLDDGTRAGGLYLLNLSVGISLRLFNIPSLNPRGIPDHQPVWSPDSTQLAVALPTAYDVDIFCHLGRWFDLSERDCARRV